MGHCANYIIKENDTLTIHYNHWGANYIARELLEGEKAFMRHVRTCDITERPVPYPMLEGCVILDLDARKLYFWETEFTDTTSVMDYYLLLLADIWSGWEVRRLVNEMYDADKIIELNYIPQQQMEGQDEAVTEQDIINDEEVGYFDTLVIIREAGGVFVTKLKIFLDQIVDYGEAILPLLKNKPSISLPKESDRLASRAIVIDTVAKVLIADESMYGTWEAASMLWPDYSITMGRYGYITLLRLAGIDGESLKMTEEEVKKEFSSLLFHDASFDSKVLAEAMKMKNDDIQFHPNFFDKNMGT